MEELGLMEQSSLLQLDAWEIPRAQVVLNRMLGEGAFGTVYGGEAIISKDESSWVPVAVKTLKVGSAPEDKVSSTGNPLLGKDYTGLRKLFHLYAFWHWNYRRPEYNLEEETDFPE